MGVTAAHRALERVANGTCTQVWAWMTNKCRRRMNGGEGYITTEISQRKRGVGGRKKRKRRRKKKKEERLLGDEMSWELTSSDEKSFLPRM